jgi:carbonic anhydrase
MCQDCLMPTATRRGLFLGAAAMAAAATLRPFEALAAEVAPSDSPPPNAIPPAEALKRLQEGNARYTANVSTNKDFSAGRAARAQAQYPFASIVGCSDSRVAPELLFDQGPGELFVVRVAGNFVSEYGLATLEYGGIVLGAPLILVLGHSNCGAVKSAIKAVKDGTVFPGHLPALMSEIEPAVKAAMAKNPPDLLAEAIAENVRLNVKYLQTAHPVVTDLVAAGKLAIAGAVYDIATGKVSAV